MDKKIIESLGVLIPEGTEAVYNRKAAEVAFMKEEMKVGDPITVYCDINHRYTTKVIALFERVKTLSHFSEMPNYFLYYKDNQAFLIKVK